MSPEEIIQKYEIENYWEQLFFRQFVKAFQKQQGFQLYLLSHLSWMVLFSVPLLALFLKFLYYRHKRLYVEHLVYILHLHTFFFAISALLITYLLFQEQNYSFSSHFFFIILLLGLYLSISIKKVYKQKAIKTGLKVLIFLIAYFIIITIAFVMFIGLNFLFF